MHGGVNVERYGVWKTKCGLCVNPEHHRSMFDGSASYMGIEYCVENNNVLLTCPYNHDGYIGQSGCEYREKNYDNIKILSGWCAVSKINKPYDYKQSAEKINDDNDSEYNKNVEKLYIENPLFRECACIERQNNDVKIIYSLDMCLIWRNGCDKPVCAVTRKERNLELVNIYCDTKYIVDEGMLTQHEAINKGKKLTSSPLVTECAERKLKEYQQQYAQWWSTNTKIKHMPFRIYIKKGKVKDLLQDLLDTKEGLEVVHAGDLEKQSAQEKRNRKLNRQKLKQRKSEKKYIERLKQDINIDNHVLKVNAEIQLKKRNIDIETLKEKHEQISML